jgi:mono/diheme cytochrome c family protein
MKNLFYLTMALLLTSVLGLTACSGSTSPSQDEGKSDSAQAAPVGDPVAGQTLFITSCAACHGVAGEGLPGLGKDMTASEFIASKTDAELVEFIKVGRDPSDPLNTTGVVMPPKGGNPSLSDEDLYHIVAYLRTIQK